MMGLTEKEKMINEFGEGGCNNCFSLSGLMCVCVGREHVNDDWERTQSQHNSLMIVFVPLLGGHIAAAAF